MEFNLLQKMFYNTDREVTQYYLNIEARKTFNQIKDHLTGLGIDVYQVNQDKISLNHNLPSGSWEYDRSIQKNDQVTTRHLTPFQKIITRYDTDGGLSYLTEEETDAIIDGILLNGIPPDAINLEFYVGEPELTQHIVHVEHVPLIDNIERYVDRPDDYENTFFEFVLPIATNYG